MKSLSRFLIWFMCCQAGIAYAIDNDANTSIDSLAPKEEKFKELNLALPAFPEEDNLQAVGIDSHGTGYRYFVDLKSLKVDDDGVTRYTMILKSSSGAQNVFYEGIRCETGEYKTYAYGTTAGSFYALSKPSWQRALSGDARHYHLDLARNYLCDQTGYNYEKTEVVRRFRTFDELNDEFIQ